MTIPIIAFLLLYLLFVVIWGVFSLIALYHLIKYGQVNFITFFTAFAYLVVAVLFLNLSYQYISQIDWSANLSLFQGGANFFDTSSF